LRSGLTLCISITAVETRRNVTEVEEGQLDARGWTLSTAAVDMDVLGEPVHTSFLQNPRGALLSKENEGGGAI
jgi:hypothetical protein